jgi:4-hydroxyphenylpyruvate dioxygenase
VEDLKLAAEVAERWGVRIAYEAVSWGTHVNTWEAAWELVKEVGHMNLGICLDTFHVFARGDCSRIERLAEVAAEKIFFVQLADAPRVKMELMTYSRHHRRFPAQGGFPIVEFVRALAEMGYQGPLALEVFNDEFRAAPARGVACDGFRSLVFLLEEVYKGILPPLPEVEGIEYVEFAVDEARVRLLGEFLRDMGLRRVARHRSKNVELFSRGIFPGFE